MTSERIAEIQQNLDAIPGQMSAIWYAVALRELLAERTRLAEAVLLADANRWIVSKNHVALGNARWASVVEIARAVTGRSA